MSALLLSIASSAFLALFSGQELLLRAQPCLPHALRPPGSCCCSALCLLLSGAVLLDPTLSLFAGDDPLALAQNMCAGWLQNSHKPGTLIGFSEASLLWLLHNCTAVSSS